MLTFISDCAGLFTETFNAAWTSFGSSPPWLWCSSALACLSISIMAHENCNTIFGAGCADPDLLQRKVV